MVLSRDCERNFDSFTSSDNLLNTMTRMMKMEQLTIQNQLAFMDSLSRANGAGHKVDNELKEVVQQLRILTGVVSYKEEFDKAVKTEAKVLAQGTILHYIQKLQEDDTLTFKQAEKAREDIWKIK